MKDSVFPSTGTAAPDSTAPASFLHFLGTLQGLPSTDDVLAWMLPLLEQVAALHARGRVAPLQGVDAMRIGFGQLWFEDKLAHEPKTAWSTLAAVDSAGRLDVSRRLFASDSELTDLSIGAVLPGTGSATIPTAPVFLPGYVSWEHVCGHHDPLTDIFVLGQMLASLACGLNLSDDEDLRRFVAGRDNLFSLNDRLNPVLARVIVRMTELSRQRREPDLAEVLETLRNYRVLGPSLDAALPTSGEPRERMQALQEHLRDRLFDTSRRNRLLYFKPSQQTLNLTMGSFPLLLDVNNVKAEQLFYWHEGVARQICSEAAIPLHKYLRFEDMPFLAAQLDQIRSAAQRDQNEYGFSQLRLAICLFRWHNFKEDKDERITSPLLLLPVTLARRKGVKDTYTLQAESTLAEVNPALRHVLRQVYDIELPEFVDLARESLSELHRQLEALIRQSEPGITLHKVERPQIQLIRQQAKLRLDQYERRRKKQLSGMARRSWGDFEYSYDPANYHPLGVQIFAEQVRPQPAALGDLLSSPRPRLSFIQQPVDEPVPQPAPEAAAEPAASMGRVAGIIVEKDTYCVEDERPRSPWDWEFDLCSLTLGNFNYRKMSLVRDYNAIVRDGVDSPSFSRLFSLDPRRQFQGEAAPLALREQFTVVPQDPTQARAISRARSGESLIIQGPPGTGKSQTITNLIADYVSRGKRVMFVCEKRAAIDVVYHRLQQQGLQRLCALIHDSQADKKSFIKDLKACYEDWLTPVANPEQYEGERAALMAAMQTDTALLAAFSARMSEVHPAVGQPLHQLYLRMAELGAGTVTRPDQAVLEELPDYALWREHGAVCLDLVRRLTEAGADPVLSRHAVRYLHPDILGAAQATARIRSAVAETLPLVQQVQQDLAALPPAVQKSWQEVRCLGQYLQQITPLLQRHLPELLDPHQLRSQQLYSLLNRLRREQVNLEEAGKKTQYWRHKPPAEEIDIALQRALEVEAHWSGVINPAWWQLRTLFNSHYDMSRHAVKPSWADCLQALKHEYACAAAVASSSASIERDWGVSDVVEFRQQVEHIQTLSATLSPALLALQQELAVGQGGDVARLLGLARHISSADRALTALLGGCDALAPQALCELLQAIEGDLGWMPLLAPGLLQLNRMPESFATAVREWSGTPDGLELAIAEATLMRLYRDDMAFARQNGAQLDQICARLASRLRQMQQLNAATILERRRSQFLANLALANQSVSQLDAAQKEFKKRYNAGRREVENEFGKVMRFKSIRELASADSGLVVRDLKPVWLMSPLSISDTLPLENDYFDVIIFDEASQIPVEEAIPPLYRGPQLIVVGDEMQLPPTNFFGTRNEGDNEAEDEDMLADLGSDSFLTQAAKNLPSTMLEWHYRSRSEALISFSNHRFYDGRLLTIPDHALVQPAPPIVVRAAQDADQTLALALQRPISHHWLPDGIYEERRNTAEALYIAHLVRRLLLDGNSLSIGVVAFSEAQQGEIETALGQLALQDKDFALLLEMAFEREDEGQFCGLFVKNLENVQGDERDLIILSTCYGFDSKRRMLMNFGPINKAGGEKRLNVVFSRAKRHMFLVSSIQHSDIRNDYNPGAFVLKAYLQYAAHMSCGDMAAARQLIELLGGRRRQQAPGEAQHAVVQQLAAALTARGYQVDFDVGQSSLRCDLALRRSGDAAYRLGLLVDTGGHYALPDLIERYLQHPELLKMTGWPLQRVFCKDWAEQPAEVLDLILQRLQSLEALP